ncbi:MAG: thiamine-binding protein [Desulfovibrio sp.]|nr:MAG: thiamine-binding protein [Desulfovibrio sp.]
MSVIIDMSIYPMDKGEHLSPYVARAVKIIEQSGLDYVFGPMSTAIEGEWDEVMAVVDQCMRELSKDCDRVLLALRADNRKGRTKGLSDKITSVREHMEGND